MLEATMTSTDLLEALMISANMVEPILNLVEMVEVVLISTNPEETVSYLYGCYPALSFYSESHNLHHIIFYYLFPGVLNDQFNVITE
jgi:hypothetical protein